MAKNASDQAQSGDTIPKEPVTRTPRYTWTLMVYLAGDNNLSDEMVWALKEIYRVGAPPGVAVTLQFDPAATDRSTRFFRAPSADAPLDIDGIFPILHDDELPDLDSGDPQAVVEFVRRSIEAAPATYYMLVLSGHGGGILGNFLTDSAAGGPPARSLTIPAVGKMFRDLRTRLEEVGLGRAGVPIDVLGLDTCLMSMAEICSEILGETTYLVGSEGFDPNTGWPYYRLLQELARRAPDNLPDPETLSRMVAQQYILYYSDYTDAKIAVDISVCDVSERAIQALETAVAEFVKAFRGYEEDRLLLHAVVVAHWRAQSYKLEEYTDLADFCLLLEEECGLLGAMPGTTGYASGEIASRCRDIVHAIAAAVRYSDYSGVEFQHSRGLSVYFPWSRKQYEDDYRFSRFAARTGWDRFLDMYVDRTQRGVRQRASSGDGTDRHAKNAIMIRPGQLELNPESLTGAVRANAPSSRMADTPRANAPSSRGTFSLSRANAPSSRANAPSSRANAPSSRANAPSSRFGQYLDFLMNDLPSRMKNGPTEANLVVPFTIADWERVQAFKQGRVSSSPAAADDEPPTGQAAKPAPEGE